MLPPSPQKVPRNPFAPNTPEPLCAIEWPKPILNAHRHHAISTRQNATNVSIMLFTDQRFCMTPRYGIARRERLISPTGVAAVIGHALSPGFSQDGYACQLMCLRFRLGWTCATASPQQAAGGGRIAVLDENRPPDQP